MANVYLLNLSEDQVIMGNVFDSSKSFLYKDPVQAVQGALTFTKILTPSSLRIFQESTEGTLYNAYSDLSKREALGPRPPVAGPFIENYAITGSPKTDDFINILLVDKPPIRTGFFKFFLGPTTFTGIITKLDRYTHYDWEKNGPKYEYIRKTDDLGYGIEISKNALYTANTSVTGSITYTPTPLNLFLRTLSGGEEITSLATTDSPSTYIQSIPGANTKISGSLPVNIFFISPEYALRYIASYPDLIYAYGEDYAKGQEHYAKYGAMEGRIISFDPIAYLNKYSDLRQTYGYDTYSATIHYITIGFKEGRTIDLSSSFNPLNGGLYDERKNYVSLTTNTIIWPTGKTLMGFGKNLTYKYNNIIYYLNNAVDFTGNVIYMRVQ